MSQTEAWNRIMSLQRSGDLASAGRALETDGSSLTQAELAECAGNQHFLARNFREAIKCYERSISLDPDHMIGRYQYLVAIDLEREGDLVGAFNRYVSCIETEPDFPDAYTDLGGMLMKAGDFAGAAQCYEDALSREPDHLGNYQNIVAAYTKLDREFPGKYQDHLAAAQSRLRDASGRLPAVPSGHSW